MIKLKNKMVFITGATGGIGTSLSSEFAGHGCSLLLSGRNSTKLKNMCDKLIEEYNIQAEYIVADLSKQSDLDRIIAQYSKKVDVLINNAGIFSNNKGSETTNVEFDDCIAVNVRAPFILSREFGIQMKKKGFGRIVNIGSSLAYYGSGKSTAYCITKHALLGLSRSFFQEFRNTGVRVYNVSPGSTHTSMVKEEVQKQNYKTFLKPDEIAQYISYIISYNNELITEEIRLNRIIIG